MPLPIRKVLKVAAYVAVGLGSTAAVYLLAAFVGSSIPVAKAQPRFQVQAAFDRAAVKLRLVHPVQHGAIDLAPAAHVKNSDYSAHGVMVSFRFNLDLRSSSYSPT